MAACRNSCHEIQADIILVILWSEAEIVSIIRPVVTYACGTWILKETITNRLMVFERKLLRKIFGPTYENGSWRIETN
jgi:hypothetical protein